LGEKLGGSATPTAAPGGPRPEGAGPMPQSLPGMAGQTFTVCSRYGVFVLIGFAPPVAGSWATAENMIRIARRTEELGYHSLWTFQRVVSPADGAWGPVHCSVQDPVVTLSYLAARTSRIRLGTAVLNVPYVAPVLLAKQLATLNILSGGRLDVGLGAGWADREFLAVGASMRDRGRRVEEFVAVLRALWEDDVVDHHGEFYPVPQMRLAPKLLPRPPILLGGMAPAALRRAGRIADGWISGSQADLKRIGESIATVKAAAEAAGRDPGSLRFVARGAVRVRPPGTPNRQLLTGTPDQIRADFDDLAAQGVTELGLDLNFDPEIGSPDADPTASVRRAEEVLEACAPGAVTDSSN
jgi:probable F420-dependent oxidoreductase